MNDHPSPSNGRTFRESVEFYLLDHETTLGRALDVALLALDLVFVGLFVAETYPISEAYGDLLWRLEVAIALVFLVEYLFRLYGAPNRVAEAFDAYTMTDLITILPTLSALVLSPAVGLAGLEFLRVAGVIRVLRFYRFTKEEQFFFGTVSAGALRAMKLALTVLILFFVFAGLFYGVEHDANPAVDTFGDAFYFIVVTLATVGFGDIVPATRLGRWVTIAAILTGIVVIPWQARQIVRQWVAGESADVTCPNCGLDAHDADAAYCKQCGHALDREADSVAQEPVEP